MKMFLIFLWSVLFIDSASADHILTHWSNGPFYYCEELDIYYCHTSECYWYKHHLHTSCCNVTHPCPLCCYNSIDEVVCYEQMNCEKPQHPCLY
ncbi:hypothetical protein Anas_07650 [Armadillidium nasatum]|uniref:Uncharacterized protein n=1 Tax=Armadillidium nasatum TaxID=96803 RepID=A0A5N5SQZ6_9CRUS|nr:hypothetical protein Anas_07650 [Armadillidium nasatum]